ncbi:MAG: hypothetical protein ABJ360_21650 [Roseobacter sp.]
MGKPNSLDLRERICAYVTEGNSAGSAVRLFGDCLVIAVQLLAGLRERGIAIRKPQGRPNGPFDKLAP